MTVEELVRKIGADFAVDRSVPIAADTELLMSGLLDSLAVMNLVVWLESEIGQSIDPRDVVIENFETASAIGALLTRLASNVA